MPNDNFCVQGYPTEDTLTVISNWPPNDYEGWLDFCIKLWSDYGSVRKTSTKLVFTTGGWSGNEEIAGAMDRHILFRILYLSCWKRGGLTVWDKHSYT
jgi:hypothetical protein